MKSGQWWNTTGDFANIMHGILPAKNPKFQIRRHLSPTSNTNAANVCVAAVHGIVHKENPLTLQQIASVLLACRGEQR